MQQWQRRLWLQLLLPPMQQPRRRLQLRQRQQGQEVAGVSSCRCQVVALSPMRQCLHSRVPLGGPQPGNLD